MKHNTTKRDVDKTEMFITCFYNRASCSVMSDMTLQCHQIRVLNKYDLIIFKMICFQNFNQ